MPQYRVTASVVGSKYIGDFEAATPDEAEALAWKEADVSLCHQCADECSDPSIGELFVEEIEPEPEPEPKTRTRPKK
jgi:hypothetical protein